MNPLPEVCPLVPGLRGLLEASVVGSFTALGYELRRRTGDWDPVDDHDLSGRTVAITGATSGLGAAAARQLASMGALSAEYSVNSAGTETTVASQVHGPFLLTSLLLEPLRRAAPGRVLTMSSGGMYTQSLDLDELEMGPEDYRGSVAYARAKRAQVTLNELWAERVPLGEVVFHAMHPGWADTPGVAESLPTFRRIMGPALRTPEQGADTMVWLAVEASVVPDTTGLFWHDRKPRHTRLPIPGAFSENRDDRLGLWQWCEEATR